MVDEAERCFASATTGHWMGVLRAIGYPCSRYNRPDDAIEDPQVVANGLFTEFNHPAAGRVRHHRVPARFHGTPAVLREPGAPPRGQHSDEVVTETGRGDRIDELRKAGVIR